MIFNLLHKRIADHLIGPRCFTFRSVLTEDVYKRQVECRPEKLIGILLIISSVVRQYTGLDKLLTGTAAPLSLIHI